MLIIPAILFFALGTALATNFMGFADTAFQFLVKTTPSSRSAKPWNLRVVGAGFMIIAAFHFITIAYESFSG